MKVHLGEEEIAVIRQSLAKDEDLQLYLRVMRGQELYKILADIDNMEAQKDAGTGQAGTERSS